MPDVIVADFNLGKGDNGLKTAVKLQQKLQAAIPVIVLTGDITPATLREISLEKCVHLSKPVNPAKLTKVIAQLLPPAAARIQAPAAEKTSVSANRTVYIVDDEAEMLKTMSQVLTAASYSVSLLDHAKNSLLATIPARGRAF